MPSKISTKAVEYTPIFNSTSTMAILITWSRSMDTIMQLKKLATLNNRSCV